MKYVFLAFFMMIAVLTSPISGYEQGKVPVKLWQEVRSTGTVRIIVMFDLSQEFLRDKADKISAAQDMLLTELSGTKFRVNGRFRYVAGMGLSVDAEGLSIVERSLLVNGVNEDAQFRIHSVNSH